MSILDVTRVAEKVLGSKQEGRIKVRRSRLMLLEDAESDLGMLEMKRWRQKTNNIK
jgi:hypothetical protein